MTVARAKKQYIKPQVVSERVFEQAALACIVNYIAGSNQTVLKVSWTGGGGPQGCGYTSS